MMAHYASFNVHSVMVQDKQYFQGMERLLTKQALSLVTNDVCARVCLAPVQMNSRFCTSGTLRPLMWVGDMH